MENNIINTLEKHIGKWLVTYDMWDNINHIQRIDKIIPRQHGYLRINGPLIHFGSIDVEMNKHAQNVEYYESDLRYIKFIKNENFKEELGNIMYNYIALEDDIEDDDFEDDN